MNTIGSMIFAATVAFAAVSAAITPVGSPAAPVAASTPAHAIQLASR